MNKDRLKQGLIIVTTAGATAALAACANPEGGTERRNAGSYPIVPGIGLQQVEYKGAKIPPSELRSRIEADTEGEIYCGWNINYSEHVLEVYCEYPSTTSGDTAVTTATASSFDTEKVVITSTPVPTETPTPIETKEGESVVVSGLPYSNRQERGVVKDAKDGFEKDDRLTHCRVIKTPSKTAAIACQPQGPSTSQRFNTWLDSESLAMQNDSRTKYVVPGLVAVWVAFAGFAGYVLLNRKK